MRSVTVSVLALALAASACARSEDVPDEAIIATESAAPVALPAEGPDPVAAEPEAPVPAVWQAARRGEGMTLRLITNDDTLLMSLSCANVPREIVAAVPGFSRDPADSRFSLMMGSAPIILVADVSTTATQGVVARAPVPNNLAAQMSTASEITAAYAAARLGPYAAPEAEMTRALLASCGVTNEDAAVLPGTEQ